MRKIWKKSRHPHFSFVFTMFKRSYTNFDKKRKSASHTSNTMFEKISEKKLIFQRVLKMSWIRKKKSVILKHQKRVEYASYDCK